MYTKRHSIISLLETGNTNYQNRRLNGANSEHCTQFHVKYIVEVVC